jgi:hypothetical protein
MNMALIVNARGESCIVHDEPFGSAPLWVGYHLDRNRMEIILDNGEVYPVELTADLENDRIWFRTSKILIIRMETMTPVEGYDTSALLHLESGRPVEGYTTSFLRIESGRVCEYTNDTEFNDGSVLRDHRDGLTLALHEAPFDGNPQAVQCDGLKRELVICWPDGGRLNLQPSSVIGRNTLIESILPCTKMRVVLEQSRAEEEPPIDPQTDDREGSGPDSQTSFAQSLDPLMVMDVLVPVSLVLGE